MGGWGSLDLVLGLLVSEFSGLSVLVGLICWVWFGWWVGGLMGGWILGDRLVGLVVAWLGGLL